MLVQTTEALQLEVSDLKHGRRLLTQATLFPLIVGQLCNDIRILVRQSSTLNNISPDLQTLISSEEVRDVTAYGQQIINTRNVVVHTFTADEVMECIDHAATTDHHRLLSSCLQLSAAFLHCFEANGIEASDLHAQAKDHDRRMARARVAAVVRARVEASAL